MRQAIEEGFTGDGLVNLFDVRAMLATNLFGTGPYTASPANLTAKVPEPSAVVLAVHALLGLVVCGGERGGSDNVFALL